MKNESKKTLGEEAFRLLDQLNVPKKFIVRLQELDPERHLTESEMDAILAAMFPNPAKGPFQG